MTWALAIHGGAGAMTRDTVSAPLAASARAALKQALQAASDVLASGGAALDAVIAAVCVLEEAPTFNAGHGAALTRDGTVELDAAVMSGGDAGAVAGAGTTRHPVALARAVMEHSAHVMIAGPAADAFARERGLEQVAPEWFVTEERRRNLAELLAAGGTFDTGMKYGTVGAVARDAHGRLAAATSTGGVTGKRPGRIGDSPLIGAGTWADDACAVSCTGSGEQFVRVGVAHELAALVRLAGQVPDAAAARVLTQVQAIGGTGGLIVLGRDGPADWRFTTPGMFRARMDASGTAQVAIFGDE